MTLSGFRYFFLFILSTQVLLGLYFQSKYPLLLIVTYAIATIVSLLLLRQIHKPSVPVVIFVIFAVGVSMVMPGFFSKMPAVSFSSSFYVLAGAAALLWMKSEFSILLFWALVFYCLSDTFFAFYQMLHLGNTRSGGLFMDANARAIYVLITMLFVFWRLSDVNRSKKVKPVILWVLLLVLMVGFHSAQSRAMLALGGLSLIGLLLYALFRSPQLRKSVLGITIAAVAGFFIFYVLFQFVPSDGLAFLNKPDGPDVRFEIWSTSWQLIKEHPIVGHGFGLFKYLYPSVRTEMGTAGHFVHNDFLEHWLASGIPGLILTLIPVVFFSYQFLKSFAKAQYQQTLFAGMGLSLMGFAFFNYFFWRLENLIVLAAVWKLAEDQSDSSTLVNVPFKHKVIAMLIFVLPVASLIAKVDEEYAIIQGGESVSKMLSWSDLILGDESQLVPMRARWIYTQIVNGKPESIDYVKLSILIDQLDSEIARGTVLPLFYCSRAELGLILNESYEETITYISSAEKLEPTNIYCAFVRFNTNIIHEKSELALEQIYAFLRQKLPGPKIKGIIGVNQFALEFAIEQESDYYISFFSQYGEYLKTRRVELGM